MTKQLLDYIEVPLVGSEVKRRPLIEASMVDIGNHLLEDSFIKHLAHILDGATFSCPQQILVVSLPLLPVATPGLGATEALGLPAHLRS